jgi:hypothetical protein
MTVSTKPTKILLNPASSHGKLTDAQLTSSDNQGDLSCLRSAAAYIKLVEAQIMYSFSGLLQKWKRALQNDVLPMQYVNCSLVSRNSNVMLGTSTE